jgi:hypothetical protein
VESQPEVEREISAVVFITSFASLIALTILADGKSHMIMTEPRQPSQPSLCQIGYVIVSQSCIGLACRP